MNEKREKISVFKYKNYRTFLRDWYSSVKEAHHAFSYRAFSKRAGFHSSNFFMLVMQGKRNLTEDSLRKMIAGLQLNKQEQEFFRNLVFFNQAKTHEDEDFYYKKMLQSKKYKLLKPIEKKKYEYYSEWYHPIVRELIASKEFDGTEEWIASRLYPPITPVQAKKSIDLLEGLGFIEKNQNGKWKQANTLISTGPEVISVVIHNYHKTLLDLSKLVIDHLKMKDRDVSSLTLGVKKERLPEIKTKIIDFRQEIMKMVSQDTEPEEVVQLNIQFFPVTKKD